MNAKCSPWMYGTVWPSRGNGRGEERLEKVFVPDVVKPNHRENEYLFYKVHLMSPLARYLPTGAWREDWLGQVCVRAQTGIMESSALRSGVLKLYIDRYHSSGRNENGCILFCKPIAPHILTDQLSPSLVSPICFIRKKLTLALNTNYTVLLQHC